jgi:IS30 family transposase
VERIILDIGISKTEIKMMNTKENRDARRLDILDGLNKGLSHEKIAEKMGIQPRMLRRDLKRMRHIKDLELRQIQKNSEAKAIVDKEENANRAGERFKRITGMTFQEKTFNNMISFYEPEIRKILRAKEQDVAIRCLPSSVYKTLKRNGIIASGWKTLQVTQRARNHLFKSQNIEN